MLLQSKNQINLNRTNKYFMIHKYREKKEEKRRKCIFTRNELKMDDLGENVFRMLKLILKKAIEL